MVSLKQRLEALQEAKKSGGFKTIKDLRLLFPTMGEVSQKVVLRTFEDEDLTVYNIFFPAKGEVEVSGEIADRLLLDFPEHFEVVAVNRLKCVTPNEVIEDKNGNLRMKLEIKNGKPVPYSPNSTKVEKVSSSKK